MRAQCFNAPKVGSSALQTQFHCSNGSRDPHRYRLNFQENGQGVEKAVEFSAPSLADALAMALNDPAERTVEIWEDGAFALYVSRKPEELEERPPHTPVKLLLDPPGNGLGPDQDLV